MLAAQSCATICLPCEVVHVTCIVHVQVQYSPAFVQGLSGGDGEYAERLNAELSPYNSTVKSMSTAGESCLACAPNMRRMLIMQ
jgi:hypothetical protein